ncbi:MAG TPA: ParB/RepB/Spo0J family partition protein [Nitrosomonas nitrosa]|jgi:ParB family chromosome partitioning protein|uniref:Chromosome segregation DNA-binding protein n=1 Tax=Nitrosomonas nitrosa TaxID=52442 RepID=A0A1I4R128_9PROT|nr:MULTISPECIES: ParB/RepB/Spo0J family partition protein [Nitrosomonas]MCW5601186.1 ParB/RepB/Spo0J family partition protein [Nitrosomonas sp.]PTR00130.1 chromosome segregation DNA-binding protein [Nitrosomonas nitrosa]CAE6509395.1 putative chromosome-partitioning protein ParB [Nitrosomonas nitrosa]SFM45633.1 chromosome segregation DNA-binding protein [Nitrosomonas nitrosa]HBZ29135.1 ParB/RepB/Spo0J family partition protein [Nitrosomonas nitrosa]
MTKLKGLGRGLDALLSNDSDHAFSESLQHLEIKLLQPGKYQPRTSMDQASLMELAESIKAQGVMQPILVRPIGADLYEIIAGERRWRAAQLAGLTQVPTIIREVPDESALAMSLIENIQRENLNPLETAMGIQRLIKEFGMTHQTAGEALGSSRSAISNLLRLLNLATPVQELMMQGKIDMGHGRALLPLSAAKQVEIANLIAHKQLSVRETEKLIKRIEQAPTRRTIMQDRDLLRLQEDISSKLGANVTIKPGKRGTGNLVIHYTSLEQLDDILSKF